MLDFLFQIIPIHQQANIAASYVIQNTLKYLEMEIVNSKW